MSQPQVLQHKYTPRGTARELFAVREPELLVSGPAGTGKSRGCLEKLHAVCLRTGGVRGLIVRKTATSLTSTALVTYREHVAAEAIEVGDVKWYGGSTEKAAGYRYSNGSFIAVGGMDKPSKIMSSEYDIAYVQEATELTIDDWEAITTRLRNGKISFQQLLADCNPSHPKHWLKQRCDRGAAKILFSTHKENPRIYDDEGNVTEQGASYISKLQNLTGVRKQRLLDGLWVAAEGVIYEDWREDVHLIPRTTVVNGKNKQVIQPHWTRYWVIDFGYKHPFVWQAWAEDDDGRLYLYREIFMTGRLVEEHAKQIMRTVTKPTREKALLDRDELGPLADLDKGWRKWTEPEPSLIICDHDAEGRATLEKYLGWSTIAATKSVTEGIERVQARMKVQDDGKPRIFILHDSLVELDKELDNAKQPTKTADEIAGYIWDQADGPGKKERPVKFQDDGCDCMRYMVAQKDLGPGSPNWRAVS